MNANPAPAPWAHTITESESIIRDARGRVIATLPMVTAEGDAAGCLMAAAPELLEALKALADSAGQWTGSSGALRVAHFQARVAIAKATGEQQ